MSTGLSWMGGMIAKGVNKTGSFINSKLSGEKKDQILISNETKEKFKKI